MDDAVARYRTASEENDIDALMTALAPDAELVSPLSARLGPVAPATAFRLDVHPADFDHPGHVRALETALARTRLRESITYDELVAR